MALGDAQGALEDCDQALRLDSGDAKAYFNRGMVCGDLGDAAGSIADFKQAVQCDPGFIAAWFNLGFECRRTGDYAGAIRAFNHVIQEAPTAREYLELGLAYLAQHKPKKAAADFRKALKLHPPYTYAQAMLGLALYLEGETAEAADLYRAAAAQEEQLRDVAGVVKLLDLPDWAAEPLAALIAAGREEGRSARCTMRS